jgi:hypothetical protein
MPEIRLRQFHKDCTNRISGIEGVSMSHAMVVIPVKEPLNLFTVRMATSWLRGMDVMPFNDGMYHATISQKDAIALLGGFSEHDAAAAGFEIVSDNPTRFVFARLRWEVAKDAKEVQIFGPHSSPAETKVFEQERQSDGITNARPEKS